MRIPLILLCLSLACVGGSLAAQGTSLTLPLAVSLLSSLAALLITLRVWIRLRRGGVEIQNKPKRRTRKTARHAVIDGSNVMHWNGETPDLATLREVIASVRSMGYKPGVIFDANAGYKIKDRYLDDRKLAKMLKLPRARVLVVGKGTPADPTILTAAREMKAKVITNDRFRDWAGDFPEIANSSLLVRGGYRAGKLWLDEGALAAA